MALRIIAVGKQHDKLLAAAIERYLTRLKKPYDVEWVLIPHSLSAGTKAAEEESERIKKRLRPHDFVVVLDERGRLLSSPQLSEYIEAAISHTQLPVFVIGGAYGVSAEFREQATLTWSLSPLVFPHQLVRLILVEQLYRAQTIARGDPYHHE